MIAEFEVRLTVEVEVEEDSAQLKTEAAVERELKKIIDAAEVDELGGCPVESWVVA